MQVHIKRFLLSITTLALIASPLLASAEEGMKTPEVRKVPTSTASREKTQSGFCLRAANVRTELGSKFSELDKNRGDKRTEILSDLKERKDQRADKVQEKRDEIKTNFENNLTDLRKVATTDAQKAALTTFKAIVDRALSTRKTAVDAAVNAYRTGLESLVSKRQEAIRVAGATLKASITAATAKAAADCAAGGDQFTVRKALLESVKAAQDKFKTDMQAVEKIGTQVKDLLVARNKAIQAANETFKATVKTAKETLKAAFAEPTTP